METRLSCLRGGPGTEEKGRPDGDNEQDHRCDKGPCARDRSHIGMASLCGRPDKQLDAGRAVQSVRKAGQAQHASGWRGRRKLWHQLSDERNRYLDGVDAELIGRVKSGGFARITNSSNWSRTSNRCVLTRRAAASTK